MNSIEPKNHPWTACLLWGLMLKRAFARVSALQPQHLCSGPPRQCPLANFVWDNLP